jgi:hypothetical protein
MLYLPTYQRNTGIEIKFHPYRLSHSTDNEDRDKNLQALLISTLGDLIYQVYASAY